MIRELKGRHILMIAVTAFGIIFTANLAMLFAATGSFPGLVVKNSYVASQGWNAKVQAQQDLGWSSSVAYEDGVLSIRLADRDGRPLRYVSLDVSVGRPGTKVHDQTLEAQYSIASHRVEVVLAPGIWHVRIRTLDGPAFRKTAELFIPEDR